MEALVRAVEYVDPNLVGHTRKMRHVAELLAGIWSWTIRLS